jgi:hypothetical protein
MAEYYDGYYLHIGRSQVIAMNEQKYDFQFAGQEMVPEGDSYDCIVSHTDHLLRRFSIGSSAGGKPLDFSKLRASVLSVCPKQTGQLCTTNYEGMHEPRLHSNVVCQYDRRRLCFYL